MLKSQCLLYFLLFCVTMNAQKAEINLDHIKSNFIIDEIDQSDLLELKVTDSHYSQDNKHRFVYTQQFISGIPVNNAIGVSVIETESNQIIGQTNSFRELADVTNTGSDYSLDDAIKHILKSELDRPNASIQAIEGEINQYSKYRIQGMSTEDVLSKLIYYPTEKDVLIQCIEVNIWLEDGDEWKQWILDAKTLNIVSTHSWTVTCKFDHDATVACDHNHSTPRVTSMPIATCPDSSYNVLPIPIESPVYGARGIETAPWNTAPNASPLGWHDLDGVVGADTTVTFGNNVQAYEDTDDDNAPNMMPDGGANLCFDFPFDDMQDPTTYLDAATVNLFYWNNMIHDVLYQYGFDEAAGNFQNINYTNAGQGGDFVNAECQDGGGTNNANFSTPPDGNNPRMQMYNWEISSSPDTFEVITPLGVAGLYSTISASFGPTNVSVLDTLVLADDIEGCTPLTNGTAISGQIALMDRGNCAFVNKVQEAQNQGAVAAVICNNVNTPIFAMGGTSATITIPSVMLSMSDCTTIKAAMPNVVVEISTGGIQFRDSDFDNGVIIHEYGHGVSTRLTGGASNTGCLFNDEQMGEGWSDYIGLMLTMESGDSATDSRGIGNYLLDQGPNGSGIRPLPYSTDLAVNDHTYADIANVSVPHGVGSVWCVMLWDMTWALIDEYGFDPDIYYGSGGNNMALQLVIDGLKLQACSPGFVDGRDAILLADQINNNGDNQCLIWNVFAARGLGYSASQGSTNDVNDSVEAYDLPPSCQDILAVLKTADGVITKADTIDYSLYAFNNTAAPIMSVSVEDTLSQQCTYVNGSINAGTESSNIVTVPISQFDNGTDTTITFKAVPINTTTSIQYFDDFEQASNDWSNISIQGTDGFNLSSSNPYSASQHWYIQNVGADNTHSLESIDMVLGSNPGFSLWHAYDTESGWDGGFIEYSTDGGSSWNGMADHLIIGKYNGTLGASSNDDIANQPGWSGDSGGYVNSVASLIHLSGMTVRFRLQFGSDNNTFSDGWYIDDISIYDVPCIENVACIHGSFATSFCDTVQTYVVTDCSTFYKLYSDADSDGFGSPTDSIYSCNTSEIGFIDNKDDCDDTDDTVYPGAPEQCDNVDNNCDGIIDENSGIIWYADSDNDGFGDPAETVTDCTQPMGYVADNTDCNDSNPNINPNATEICDNVDNDCNGLIDEICSGSLICQDDILYLSLNDELVVIADSLIHSDAIINMLDSTYYYAGDTITLDIGFETIIGKSFNAIIEDCTDN